MGSHLTLVRTSAAALALGCVALLAASPAATRPPGKTLDLGRASAAAAGGELIVRFKPGVGRPGKGLAHALLGARVTERIGRSGLDVVTLPPGLALEDAIAAYEADPLVEVVEPNYRRKLSQLPPPNDEFFHHLWGLHNVGQDHPVADPRPLIAQGRRDRDIDILEAWGIEDATANPNPPVIAVIDSGIDVSHRDLADSLWTNSDEIPDNGMDDDMNGYVDDIHGWNFVRKGNNILRDASGHGTHIAGTIAAGRGNDIGTAGVCPGCKIMVLKVARADGFITLPDLLEALDYAKANGADIVNASFGALAWSDLEYKAIRRSGMLVVAVAGNESFDNDLFDLGSPQYPASYDLPNVISVTASNHRDQWAYMTGCHARGGTRPECSFSNWGHESVDLLAPGVDIVSSIPDDGYATFTGTSMAAPHVAGVAGLVKSEFPEYNRPVQLKNAILNGVDRRTPLRRLSSWQFPKIKRGSFTATDGRLNAAGALAGQTAAAGPRTDGNVKGAKKMRKRVRGKVVWPHDANDVYRKRLIKGRKYKAVVRGARGSDLDLYIWKPKTREIWQITAACRPFGSGCKLFRWKDAPGRKERILFKARRSGTFYFHVSTWPGRGGKYRLVVRPR